jgi:hypothetical protein
MKRNNLTLVAALAVCGAALTLASCKEGSAEKAGANVDKAVEKAGETTGEAMNKAGDAVKDATKNP